MGCEASILPNLAIPGMLLSVVTQVSAATSILLIGSSSTLAVLPSSLRCFAPVSG